MPRVILPEHDPFTNEARDLSRELDFADELASSLDNLGIVAATVGENDEAVAFFSASLEQRRLEQDQRGTAIALEHLAYALTSLGNLTDARINSRRKPRAQTQTR